jgi:hypothetical protein
MLPGARVRRRITAVEGPPGAARAFAIAALIAGVVALQAAPNITPIGIHAGRTRRRTAPVTVSRSLHQEPVHLSAHAGPDTHDMPVLIGSAANFTGVVSARSAYAFAGIPAASMSTGWVYAHGPPFAARATQPSLTGVPASRRPPRTGTRRFDLAHQEVTATVRDASAALKAGALAPFENVVPGDPGPGAS